MTGQFAIQFAALSGYHVVAVTSSKTKPLAERLGAEHVISRDRKSNEEIVAEIRFICGDDLTKAIDIVGNETGAACIKALSTTKPSLLAPLAFLKQGEVVPANVRILDVEMKRFVLDPASRMYAEHLNWLIDEGMVHIPATEVLSGGLSRIEEGLDMLKSGDMGGKKLIVKID